MLKNIAATGGIFIGWSDEPWVLEGAAVRISIVGFDDGSEQKKQLDGVPVDSIHPDLTASLDLTGVKPLKENEGIAFEGDKKAGDFDVSGEIARQWLSLPPNPNGRGNEDVVRPWANGRDVTGRPSDHYIIDFGSDMAVEEAALYEAPFEYIQLSVKPKRLTNKDSFSRDNWWLHQRPRPAMREAVERLERFLCTSRVSRHRFFVWLSSPTLPDSRLAVFARDDDYFVGVLHSRAHEVWSLRLASWHGKGNDPTYNSTTCFDTFPFPWPPGQEPVGDVCVGAIGGAARTLDERREAWLNPADAGEAELKKRTLTNLYNDRPAWLANAHAALDQAVWDAYGWPADEVPGDVDEDVILGRLLALNAERVRAPAGK